MLKIKLNKLTTVDGILKSFTDIIDNLNTLKEHHQTAIGKNVEQIALLYEDNQKRGKEVNKAIAISNKIEQLIKE